MGSESGLEGATKRWFSVSGCPISGILALSELLYHEVAPVLTEEQLGFLSDIDRSSKFMLQLIDDLLDASSIEEGHLHLNRRPSDLRKLLGTERWCQRPLALLTKAVTSIAESEEAHFRSCRSMKGRSSRY